MKNAFETTENPNEDIKGLYKLTDEQSSFKEAIINEEKDISDYWKNKETLLWIIVLVCSFFFLYILWGGYI